MLKRIDIYLLLAFFRSLVVVSLAVGLTIIVINIVEELRDFIDHQVPIETILEYYFYWAGWVIKSFLPMFVLLAALFSMSLLARRNEILAMKACGLSLYRLALPYVIVTLLLASGHFYYNEYVFPPANQRRLEIKEYTIEQKSRRTHTNVTNVYRQIRPGYFFTLERFNTERMEGSDLRVIKTVDNRLKEVITAGNLQYRNNTWVARHGTLRTFEDDAEESFREFEQLELPEIEDKPADFARRIGKPEDMSLEELEEYIALMKRTGGPYAREAVDLGIKYAYPLTSFIVVLITVPIASNPRRGGLAVSISIGALISLTYFVLFRILQSAGYNEKIPKEIAIWGVNGLFFLFGLVSLFNARK